MNRRQRAFAEALKQLKKSAAPAPDKAVADGADAIFRGSRPRLDRMMCGDSIELLNAAPPAWADLVFADPPFNIGYLYDGYNDNLHASDYLDFSRAWMSAVHRALAPSGSFFLAIGDDYAADLCVIARRELGFVMRNWIIWHYTFGQQPRSKFAKSHTHILYFTKSAAGFTFNPDAVRVPSARQTTYADARANPLGKLPDDVWFVRPQEAPAPFFAPECDTWNVSRVCGTFKERQGWHGCQMPSGVLNRIILSASNPGDVVVDPFNGSGTTTVSAALLGRRFLGIDQSPQYVAFAQKRLQDALAIPADAAAAKRQPAARVMTTTDALGRARVERRRVRKIA